MGRKSAGELLVQLVAAFHEKRQWNQSDLAKRFGVATRTIRVRCTELLEAGLPLDRTEEPPHVWWRLPKDWVPGGVAIADRDVPTLVRLLARLPKSPARDHVLARVLANAPRSALAAVAPEAVVAREVAPAEEDALEVLHRALAGGLAIAVHYESASEGARDRVLSLQRIDAGPPARAIAHCHTERELRWFRLDRMRGARLEHGEAYVRVRASAVDAFHAASIDGFHGGRAPIACSFVVRGPDARWVAKNLPSPMRSEARDDGALAVRVESAALEQIARFVAGVRGVEQVEPEALRALVIELATSALRGCGGP